MKTELARFACSILVFMTGCTASAPPQAVRLQSVILGRQFTSAERADAYRELALSRPEEDPRIWACALTDERLSAAAKGLSLQALLSRFVKAPLRFRTLINQLHLKPFLTTETLIDANRATLTPFDPLPEDEWPGIYIVAVEDPGDPQHYLFPVYLKLSEALPIEQLLTESAEVDPMVLEVAPLPVDDALERVRERGGG